MNRPQVFVSLLLLASCLVVPGTALAQGPAASAQIDLELRLERKLLTLDLASYDEARTRELAARQRLDEVQGRLDQALRGGSLALGALENLYNQLVLARLAVRAASEEADRRTERIEERLRGISFLDGESHGRADPRDPVSGRWRVIVQPQSAAGTFELQLDGTTVSGHYSMAAGDSGSLRGTFVNQRLSLERVDSRNGFDSVWVGTVQAGRVSGTWRANELANGQPGSGSWSATHESNGSAGAGGQRP